MVTVADVDMRNWFEHPDGVVYDGNYPLSARPGAGTLNVNDSLHAHNATSLSFASLNTPFAITREASRTSGTAPLSVFFTAGFSASDGTNRDFHDLHYLWNFDDAGAGSWGTSGKSKETDTGAVASHVFESAGTHTVTLTVKDPLTGSTLDTDTFSIVVTAADTTFAGTLTTVINNVDDTDFTGKPTGATEVNTDTIGDLNTYLGSGKRVLLKRGSTWTTSSSVTVPTITSACHLGAYGTGGTIDAQGIDSNAPIIDCTSGSSLFNVNNSIDFRITDISFTGVNGSAGVGSGIVTGNTNIRQLLVHKIKSRGCSTSVGWSHWRTNETDRIEENTVASCDIQDFNDYGLFVSGEKLSLIGNKVANSDVTHIARVEYARFGVVSHSDHSGSSLTNANGRHALKLHSPKLATEVGTYAETGGSGQLYSTQYVMVANNIFGSSGSWPVSIGAQNTTSDENLSDIVVEKNKIVAGYGGQRAPSTSISLLLEGRYLTARNNIIDGTEGNSNFTGISVQKRGLELSPLAVEVYNNTIYSNNTMVNGGRGVVISSDCTDTIVKNTFVSFPSGTSGKTLVSNSGTNTTQSNNQLIDVNGFTDPDNVTPLSRDFTLALGSAAIDAGTDVLVYDDFNDAVRTGTFEQGAYDY